MFLSYLHPQRNPNYGNVVKTIINYPFGNGLYHLFIVVWGMVYYHFNHIMINCSIVL